MTFKLGNTQVKFQTLKLGSNYCISVNGRYLVMCKFIKVTKCGYNLLNVKSNKCILKRHLYQAKHKDGTLRKDTFIVPNGFDFLEVEPSLL